MPITGFLEGFNEQRKVEQTLQDQRALAGLRAVEIGMGLVNMRNQAAVQSTLGQVFSGNDTSPAGTPPEENLARKMEKAGPAIMQFDPRTGMGLIMGASTIRDKQARDKLEATRGMALDREAQGAALAAATGPENYPEAMQEYLQRGGKLPQWYTGDWEKDKDKVQFAADSSMKASDQAKRENARVRTDLAISNQSRLLEKTLADVQIATVKSQQQQERTDNAKRESDRRSANDQQASVLKSRADTKDKEDAMDELKARPEAEGLGAAERRALALRAATGARRRLVKEGGNFDDLLNEEIDKLLDPKTGVLEPAKKTRKGFDIPFLGYDVMTPAKLKPRAKGAEAPAPVTKKVDAPPAALQYLKSHPESAAAFKEKYGYLPE